MAEKNLFRLLGHLNLVPILFLLLFVIMIRNRNNHDDIIQLEKLNYNLVYFKNKCHLWGDLNLLRALELSDGEWTYLLGDSGFLRLKLSIILRIFVLTVQNVQAFYLIIIMLIRMIQYLLY